MGYLFCAVVGYYIGQYHLKIRKGWHRYSWTVPIEGKRYRLSFNMWTQSDNGMLEVPTVKRERKYGDR